MYIKLVPRGTGGRSINTGHKCPVEEVAGEEGEGILGKEGDAGRGEGLVAGMTLTPSKRRKRPVYSRDQ